MDQAATRHGRYTVLSMIYGLLLLLPAFFGVFLSFFAERGGITQGNAFLAIFLGPWSEVLPPNAHPMSAWTICNPLFTECLTLLLVSSVAGAYFAKSRRLRHAATGVSIPVIVVWVLAGLAKVVLEMH